MYVCVRCEYSRESENCLREFNNRWRVRVEEERKRRRGKILNSIVTRCSKMYSIDWFSNIAGYSIIKGYRNIFPFKKYRGWLAGIGNYAWLFAYCNFVASFQGRNTRRSGNSFAISLDRSSTILDIKFFNCLLMKYDISVPSFFSCISWGMGEGGKDYEYNYFLYCPSPSDSSLI